MLEKSLPNGRRRKRLQEMSHYAEYDYLIVNDDFDTALSGENHHSLNVVCV